MLPDFSAVATISNQRCGSKFIGSCLRAGADFRPLGEIFNPDAGQALTYWSWLASQSGLAATTNKVSVALLDRFFDSVYVQFGPFHFDLMYNQLSAVCPPWHDHCSLFIVDYLRQRRIRLLHCLRSPLDVFLSLQRLRVSGVAHSSPRVSGSEHPGAELTVDLAALRGFVENYWRWADTVGRQLAHDPCGMTVEFDELVSADGFLPPRVMAFFVNAIKASGPEYGQHMQLRRSLFGTAPDLGIRFSNGDDAAALYTQLLEARQRQADRDAHNSSQSG
jgi:hypothetical protein